MTDIEIAQSVEPERITVTSERLGLDEKYLEPHGKYKAKIDPAFLKKEKYENGRLILVTAVTPTPAGEGKTTTTIGIADAMNRMGVKAVLALREPSLGPVFGIKGGAAGGGYSQVIPMEDINLHFTGDFHAVTAANNLLAAAIDNHIHFGNSLGIDPRSITWKRCMDLNDRQLRSIVDGLGGKLNGVPREDGFEITAASEVMATFCLAEDRDDLKQRLGNIIIGFTYDKRPVRASEIGVVGAMAALLKEAIMPNLVQTLEHNPALVHGGPFANIAHGCNTVIATKTALALGDYCITEAGFGSDLGAEKFFDIKCRKAGLDPSAVVLVATIRALKMHGGKSKEELKEPDVEALRRGEENLRRHINVIRDVFHLPVVVAINHFVTDTEEEVREIFDFCEKLGVPCSLSEVWAKGGGGALDLAQKLIDACDRHHAEGTGFSYCYEDGLSVREKIEAVAKKVYGAERVVFSAKAEKKLVDIDEEEKTEKQPYCVCIAKTQYSFTDNAKKIGAPTDFVITVRDVKISGGAGFVVAFTGDVMTMPALPRRPSAEDIDIDSDGRISGLF